MPERVERCEVVRRKSDEEGEEQILRGMQGDESRHPKGEKAGRIPRPSERRGGG